VVAFVVAPQYARSCAAACLRLAPQRHHLKARRLARFILTAQQVVVGVCRTPRTGIRLLGLSAALIVAAWLRMQFTLVAVVGSIPVGDGLVIFALAQLLGMVPLKTAGGFGFREGGVFAVLVALDYSLESAAVATTVLAVSVPLFPSLLWLIFKATRLSALKIA